MPYLRHTFAVPFSMLSVCCVAVQGIWLQPVAVAAPADPIADVQGAQASAGQAAIRDALERKVSVNFANQPFTDVLAWLKQSQRLNVAVDAEHIDAEGNIDGLTVTFAAQDQPLGSVLKRLLSRLELIFDIRDDVLVISTHEREPVVELRAYDVRALAASHGAFDEVEYDCRPLIEALTTTVGRGHWNDYDAGHASALGGTLLVSQSADVHDQVEWFLAALRQVRDNQAKKPSREPVRVERPDTAKVQQSIRRKLEKLTTLRYSETPLADAVATLRDVSGLPVELDMIALREVGEPSEIKISLDVHNIPMRSVLKRMLGRMDLAFVIHEQTLLITTSERAAETLRTVVYPVRDLVEHAMTADDSEESEAYEKLAEAIRGVVAPRNWDNFGGNGELRPVPGASALVCIQTDEAHAELARMLDALRAAHRRQQQTDLAQTAAPQEARQPGDAAAQPQPDLRTKVYKLYSGAVANDRSAAELERLITGKIEPETWRHSGPFVAVVGDALVVRQTPAVQQRVGRLLRKIAVLAPRNAELPAMASDPAEPMETPIEVIPGAPIAQ